MKRIPFSAFKALFAGLLMFAAVVVIPSSASAAVTPPPVPIDIAVPAGFKVLFMLHATGVQTYECENGQWLFRAPRALLFDPATAQPVGQHFGGIDRQLTPGPWWDAMRDTSRIRAGRAIPAPSPNPNSIPLLRLEVLEREGAGMFSQVAYIQRLNTVGGVGPSGACTSNARELRDYSADYYFFGPE
jgi:hypothetical protein